MFQGANQISLDAKGRMAVPTRAREPLTQGGKVQVERLVLVDSAGAGYYSEEQLEAIACPTLVVWGEDDVVIPLANAAWFGAAIPHTRVELISHVTQQEGVPPWGGHHPMRFKPAEFNLIITDFLRTTR